MRTVPLRMNICYCAPMQSLSFYRMSLFLEVYRDGLEVSIIVMRNFNEILFTGPQVDMWNQAVVTVGSHRNVNVSFIGTIGTSFQVTSTISCIMVALLAFP